MSTLLKKYYSIWFCILAIFLSTSAFSAASQEKIYVLRISSVESNQPVAFSGNYIFYTKSGSVYTPLNTMTPFEIALNTTFLSTNIKAATHDPKIKLQIIEKKDIEQYTRLSGIGHSFVAHISTEGNSDLIVN